MNLQQLDIDFDKWLKQAYQTYLNFTCHNHDPRLNEADLMRCFKYLVENLPEHPEGVNVNQNKLMTHDPVTGKPKPYPSQANQYRIYHGKIAWLYNPWTGKKRDPRDIGSDVNGLLMADQILSKESQ